MSSAWDLIVGIPLSDWMRADTPEQIEWLAWLRDHPMPAPPVPECSCERVDIIDFRGVSQTVPGRPDPHCRIHGRRCGERARAYPEFYCQLRPGHSGKHRSDRGDIGYRWVDGQ